MLDKLRTGGTPPACTLRLIISCSGSLKISDDDDDEHVTEGLDDVV